MSGPARDRHRSHAARHAFGGQPEIPGSRSVRSSIGGAREHSAAPTRPLEVPCESPLGCSSLLSPWLLLSPPKHAKRSLRSREPSQCRSRPARLAGFTRYSRTDSFVPTSRTATATTPGPYPPFSWTTSPRTRRATPLRPLACKVAHAYRRRPPLRLAQTPSEATTSPSPSSRPSAE